MIELIENRNDWAAAIDAAKETDFYQSYDYHQLSKEENEHPLLVKYDQDDTTIAIPLLIRDIPGTSYKDATSVYGYSGPFTRNLRPDFDNQRFIDEVNKFFRDHKIVSVFSRLNPFIPYQNKVLYGMGSTTSPGKVVYIDLQKDEKEQLAFYNRRLKTYVNKSRRVYTIKKAETTSEIMQFIAMYYENMRRVQARKHYFFKEDYFFDLLASKDFDAEILLALKTGTESIVGGAMFLKNKRIVQYHLSGAKEGVLKLNPIKLLIDEMRIRGSKDGYYYLNLGGGVGNKEDSLFHFKAGFSKETRSFELWRYIVNQEVYNELVKEKEEANNSSSLMECGDFFPKYRCDLL